LIHYSGVMNQAHDYYQFPEATLYPQMPSLGYRLEQPHHLAQE